MTLQEAFNWAETQRNRTPEQKAQDYKEMQLLKLRQSNQNRMELEKARQRGKVFASRVK